MKDLFLKRKQVMKLKCWEIILFLTTNFQTVISFQFYQNVPGLFPRKLQEISVTKTYGRSHTHLQPYSLAPNCKLEILKGPQIQSFGENSKRQIAKLTMHRQSDRRGGKVVKYWLVKTVRRCRANDGRLGEMCEYDVGFKLLHYGLCNFDSTVWMEPLKKW